MIKVGSLIITTRPKIWTCDIKKWDDHGASVEIPVGTVFEVVAINSRDVLLWAPTLNKFFSHLNVSAKDFFYIYPSFQLLNTPR